MREEGLTMCFQVCLATRNDSHVYFLHLPEEKVAVMWVNFSAQIYPAKTSSGPNREIPVALGCLPMCVRV